MGAPPTYQPPPLVPSPAQSAGKKLPAPPGSPQHRMLANPASIFGVSPARGTGEFHPVRVGEKPDTQLASSTHQSGVRVQHASQLAGPGKIPRPTRGLRVI